MGPVYRASSRAQASARHHPRVDQDAKSLTAAYGPSRFFLCSKGGHKTMKCLLCSTYAGMELTAFISASPACMSYPTV
eukprot:2493083-Rhodomonas_salina.2